RRRGVPAAHPARIERAPAGRRQGGLGHPDRCAGRAYRGRGRAVRRHPGRRDGEGPDRNPARGHAVGGKADAYDVMRAIASRICCLATLLLGAVALPADAATGATAAPPTVERIRLDDGHLQVEVAPAIGGRIVHLSLPGRANMLRVGAAALATVPAPEPSAEGPDLPYFGHELWLGPQSRWWLDQDVNQARRDAAAPWPPDPWLAHARNRIVQSGPHALVLEGVASPVSGLQATQSFRLSGGTPATLELGAEAVNRRDRDVRRNL